MSYINYEIMTSKLLTLYELGVLQLVKQNRIEDLSQQIEFSMQGTDILEKFSNMGYIEFIKGKKGQSTFQLIRATKKGVDTLDLINTPEITDGDYQLYQYLCEMYINEDATRTLGNRKAGLIYSAQFRQLMGFTLHEAFYLYEMFINNMSFTKVLEYIFFSKKENPYGKFKDNYEGSKLYQFWQDNEYEIRDYWAQKIKTEE